MANWTEPKVRLDPDTELDTSKTFSLMEIVMFTPRFRDYTEWLRECFPNTSSLSECLDDYVDVEIVNE